MSRRVFSNLFNLSTKHMSKYTVGAFIITGVVMFFFFSTSSDQERSKTPYVASAVIVEKTFHDFGTIDIFGGKVSTTYTLKNTGEEDVSIVSAVTSCMCTEGEIGGLRFGMHNKTGLKVVISAGEEKILTAIYDPLAHGPNGTGKITRELTLTTDSSETPKIMVRFSADVVKNMGD